MGAGPLGGRREVILVEYVTVFALVAVMGAGIPGPGDASLLAAGTAAGEGRLSFAVVLAVATVAWMLGSVIGYEIGHHFGRGLLEHSGWFEKRRRALLEKGDRAFGRHDFAASTTLPAFLSGIFRVRFGVFVLGAVVAGVFWIGIYLVVSYFLGAEIATAIGSAGTKALLGVALVVVIGLVIRFGWTRWRARARPVLATSASDPEGSAPS